MVVVSKEPDILTFADAVTVADPEFLKAMVLLPAAVEISDAVFE